MLAVVAAALLAECAALAWLALANPLGLAGLSRAAARARAYHEALIHRARQRLALALLAAYLRVSGRDACGLIPVRVSWTPSVAEPNRIR